MSWVNLPQKQYLRTWPPGVHSIHSYLGSRRENKEQRSAGLARGMATTLENMERAGKNQRSTDFAKATRFGGALPLGGQWTGSKHASSVIPSATCSARVRADAANWCNIVDCLAALFTGMQLLLLAASWLTACCEQQNQIPAGFWPALAVAKCLEQTPASQPDPHLAQLLSREVSATLKG